MASLVSIPDDIRGIVCTYLPAEDLICMARVSRVCRKAVRAARYVWSSTPLRWGHLRALTSVLSPQLTTLIIDLTGTPTAVDPEELSLQSWKWLSAHLLRLSVFTQLAKLSLVSHALPVTVFEDLEPLTSLRCLRLERRTKSKYSRPLRSSPALWSHLTELTVLGLPLHLPARAYLQKRRDAGHFSALVWDTFFNANAAASTADALIAKCQQEFQFRLAEWIARETAYRGTLVLEQSPGATCTDKKVLALVHTNRADIIALNMEIYNALAPPSTTSTPLSMLAEDVRYFSLIEERLRALRAVTDKANEASIREESYFASRSKSGLVDMLDAVPLSDAAEVLAARRIRSAIMPP